MTETNIVSGNSSADSNPDYMPQLDSLRTFAVMFVLLEHWLQNEPWTKLLPFGMIGVTLFFVLSGFLISRILMVSRNHSETKGLNKFLSIKQFYIRRTLRIFPIYYITIFICFIINFQSIREKFLWFLFYASNIYFYKISSWAGSLSHLWTLAVEEQFYILWPFVILFIPKKYLLKSIIGLIVFGPLFRTVLFILDGRTELASTFIHILTPSCMDCFGLGALIAYYKVYESGRQMLKTNLSVLFLILNIFSVVVLLFFEENVVSVFLFRFNVSVICLYVIYKAITGFKGLTGIILENPVLLFLGKISYGLYLYHNFISSIYKTLGFPEPNNIYMNFIIRLSMLILISVVSWYLIEKPVNNLKKYFRYV